MASVEERVKQIIVEQLGVDEAEVTPTASFVDDLGADSLDQVELVMAFEEAFGLGVLLLLTIVWLPRAIAIGVGAIVALAYFAIVNYVLNGNTPSAAMSIYHWHYGHLLNYNGLAQTITLVFPLLLLFHLWRIRKV